MPYFIYRLTSPSGKVYIGLSINVRARWGSHQRRARETDRAHPLYAALRKYGAEQFKVETLCAVEDADAAKAAEVEEIARHQSTVRRFGYNISPGGDYDGTTGADCFWSEIRLDPQAFAAYRAKLAAAGQRRSAAGLIDASHLVAANAALPARVRWQRAYRASRVARHTAGSNPTNTGRPGHGNGELVKAAWEALPPSKKKRHSMQTRANAKALWARRTGDEVASVAGKISESVKALHDDPVYRERNLAGLAKGRANMSREVQGAAASKGLKKFWEDLKADPEKYAAYMKARTDSLMKTIAKK